MTVSLYGIFSVTTLLAAPTHTHLTETHTLKTTTHTHSQTYRYLERPPGTYRYISSLRTTHSLRKDFNSLKLYYTLKRRNISIVTGMVDIRCVTCYNPSLDSHVSRWPCTGSGWPDVCRSEGVPLERPGQ